MSTTSSYRLAGARMWVEMQQVCPVLRLDQHAGHGVQVHVGQHDDAGLAARSR
ncbi:hypothetical protein ACFFGR_16035 [Arthrobacter liuii]|uniref:hypothetical protein n=1 Tax=Arthrobacter liuii TaxID=1476996 RepID=UPI001E44EA0C|nr:hypothetical protein [Arthrobacter liuii]